MSLYKTTLAEIRRQLRKQRGDSRPSGEELAAMVNARLAQMEQHTGGLAPLKPDTILSWGKPPEGFYNNPTELTVEPYKYRVIAHANPAQVICPIHVK